MKKWTNFFQDYRNIPIKSDSDLLYQVALTVNGKPISKDVFNFIVLDIEKSLELSTSDNLLDLCCGNGIITFEIAKKVKTVVGVDSSKLYIENANNFKKTSSIEYLELDILELEKTGWSNSHKFNKVLFYGSIAYFNRRELSKILEELIDLTTEDALIMIGNVLDYSKRFKFYNTVRRKGQYLLYKYFNKDLGVGNWWRRSTLQKTCSMNGYSCTFLDQNPSLNTAHYRFDCILKKIL